MARCEECIHYAVCAKEGRMVQVDEHTWDDYNQLDNVECFCENYISTADVAPRAEVDELIHKLECLLCHATGSKLSYHTYPLSTMERAVTDYIQECYDGAYDEAREEVAREIFEEIASKQITIVDHVGTMGVVVLLKDIFELKKKYTDAETELPKGD